ncbi:MAG TPA: methyltransferase domain-containing protein, partial [Solirubrobacterales bacterium]
SNSERLSTTTGSPQLNSAPCRANRASVASSSAAPGGRPSRAAEAAHEQPWAHLDSPPMSGGVRDGLVTLLRDGHEERNALMAPAGRLRLGLDYRDGLLAGARERSRARSLANVSFEQADLTRPLAADGFDVVMAIECLSEIPEDRQAVRMLADALRPGGLFVVQVPDQRWRPILPGSSARWREEVRHGYEADELARMLEAAGLEAVEVRPTFRSVVAVAQELRDRVKDSPLALRLALFPPLAAAVVAERHGLTWGPPNAMLATARRPGAE